jgi:hypothetical protein
MTQLQEIDDAVRGSVPLHLVAALQAGVHDPAPSPLDIIVHINAIHAPATFSYLEALQDYLGQPADSATSFEAIIAEVTKIHTIFDHELQPFAAHQKLRHLKAIFDSLYREDIDLYLQQHPLIANQTFDGLTAALRVRSQLARPAPASQLGFSALLAALPRRALGANREKSRSPARLKILPCTKQPRSWTPKGWCHYHGDCNHDPFACSMKDTAGFQVTATKANPMGGPTNPRA